jgi:hypothetical protein
MALSETPKSPLLSGSFSPIIPGSFRAITDKWGILYVFAFKTLPLSSEDTRSIPTITVFEREMILSKFSYLITRCGLTLSYFARKRI